MNSCPVLIVEDDALQCEMLSTLLMRKLRLSCLRAHNGKEALDVLGSEQGEHIKIVILDLEMPVMGGIEALEIIRERYPYISVIMLTGNSDVDKAVEAMRLGALDYLSKPYQGDRIMVTVKNALRMSVLAREVHRLSTVKDGCFGFSDVVGYDNGLLNVVTLARKVAANNIPVLVSGETGTGKEVLATALHGESLRSGCPFIAINCGAIPANLVESTLFGHEKGAFTGATEKAIGKFREADGGTIFLDEVGELPLETQVKLLRVLQQKEVEPVGATQAVPVDVRIISATNRDLEQEVKLGHFREDLYFRLNVMQLHMPALRERREDILALTDHFIDRYAALHGGVIKTMSHQLKNALKSFDWPGNVRQLENMVNRAMVMSDRLELDLQDFDQLRPGSIGEVVCPAVPTSEGGRHHYLDLCDIKGALKTMDQLEARAIEHALSYCEGNITKAAEALGMAKSTFYKKLKFYGLERK